MKKSKLFLTASAAAITAAALIFVNNPKVDKHNDSSETEQPDITETTASVTVDQPENEAADDYEEPEHETLYGTGPEKPEDYEPNLIYSQATPNWIIGARKHNLRKSFDFIADRDFADSIAEYIDRKSNEVLEIMDSEMNETDREMYMTDFDGERDEFIYYMSRIMSIVNGYMTVEIIASAGSDSTYLFFVFDLVESRIIENYTDMFWKDVNISELLERADSASASYKEKYGYGISGGADFIAYYPNDTEYDNNRMISLDSGSYQYVIDSMISGVYRDVSPYVTLEVTDKKRVEWRSEGIAVINADGHEALCVTDISDFHSEDEILQYNSKKTELYKTALKRMISDEFNLPADKNKYKLNISNKTCSLFNGIVEVHASSLNDIGSVFIDEETGTVVDPDELLKGWRDNIIVPADSDQDVTEALNDLNNYNIVGISSLEGYSIPFVYDGDITDKAVFEIIIKRKNEDERIYLETVIPVENIEIRYFNREAYDEVMESYYANIKYLENNQ